MLKHLEWNGMDFLALKILRADWLLFPIPFHFPIGLWRAMSLLARKWVPLARLNLVWQSCSLLGRPGEDAISHRTGKRTTDPS